MILSFFYQGFNVLLLEFLFLSSANLFKVSRSSSENETWLTPKQAAMRLGVSASLIYKLKPEVSFRAAIIAYTVKGRGVSFMEGKFFWHTRVLTPDEYATAMADLEKAAERLAKVAPTL